MTISIFTPVHKITPYLDALYDSIKAQDYDGPVEWVIVLNGESRDHDFGDMFAMTAMMQHRGPVVCVIRTAETGNIGYLKRLACNECNGEILVEVDHDDYLAPDALRLIAQAFESPEVQFVYSNFREFLPDGSSNVYSPAYGWHSRELPGDGTEMIAFPPLPQYLRRIEWAPNHVRAFRASTYREIGGYDADLEVGDDHDLICRFFLEFGQRGFAHIDKCLYHYRVHDGNTSNGNNRNAAVQAQVDVNYCLYAERMAMRWAKDNSLHCLDLGGRFNSPPGYKSVDLLDADITADLTKPWPFTTNSVGVLRAYHVLEHLPDTIHFMNEAYRVLAPGGLLLIEVPSTNHPAAFADPTHVRFFNTLSFNYFTTEAKARFIRPHYMGRFQKSRIVEYAWPDGTLVVSAQMIALKGWYDARFCGLKEI